jgi:hypothetical protein
MYIYDILLLPKVTNEIYCFLCEIVGEIQEIYVQLNLTVEYDQLYISPFTSRHLPDMITTDCNGQPVRMINFQLRLYCS